MPTPESKACTKCGETKPLDEFHRDRSRSDGRHRWCKVCLRARRNAWYAKNRETNLAYQAEWREANKDLKAEGDRAWREANADRKRITDAAWRRANKERIREKNRAYHQANKVKSIEARARRRARLRGVATERYTRLEIYTRDEGKCRLCGTELNYKPGGFEIDHIIPIVLGGPDTPANVQLACRSCNRRKSATLMGQLHFAA